MKTRIHARVNRPRYFSTGTVKRAGQTAREKERRARSYVCLHGVCFQCVWAGCEAVVAAASTHAAGLLKMAASSDFHVWNNNRWLRPRKKSS